MDISKLKIGDYVIVKPTNKVGQINKIYTYKNPEHNKVGVDLLLCDAESVEPINITPEIIRCFSYIPELGTDTLFYLSSIKTEDFEITVSFSEDADGVFVFMEQYNCFNNNEICLDIKYVHELQHLLDMFNVPYEFDLKKYENNCK